MAYCTLTCERKYYRWTYLPRDATKSQEQHVVRIVPLVPRRNGSDPVPTVEGDGFDRLVDPCVGDADDLLMLKLNKIKTNLIVILN